MTRNLSGRVDTALALLIGTAWAVAAFGKSASLLWPSTTPENDPTWTARFPATLIWLVVATEVVVAFGLIAGKSRPALLGGIALLATFGVAFLAWPPVAGQDCGCLGVVPVSSVGDVPGRIAYFGGLHVLALAAADKAKNRRN